MEFEIVGWGWVAVILCAFTIGVSKTGVPGAGVLVVPVMALLLPARLSTGFVLPMLIIADIVAVTYYRRHVEWKYLAELAPAAICGILLGWLGMKYWFTQDEHLGPIIGVIVLIMLCVHFWRNRKTSDPEIPKNKFFGIAMGTSAGFTTMLANAAGPIMIIYLLAKKLPKDHFIGTGAWFFIGVNLFKIPFQINLNNITLETFKINLLLAPIIIAGAFSGLWLVKRIPQKTFNSIMQVLAALAALKLLNLF